jgi:hypothetical protein
VALGVAVGVGVSVILGAPINGVVAAVDVAL